MTEFGSPTKGPESNTHRCVATTRHRVTPHQRPVVEAAWKTSIDSRDFFCIATLTWADRADARISANARSTKAFTSAS